MGLILEFRNGGGQYKIAEASHPSILQGLRDGDLLTDQGMLIVTKGQLVALQHEQRADLDIRLLGLLVGGKFNGNEIESGVVSGYNYLLQAFVDCENNAQ